MINDIICGTYWLVRNENGSLWLVQDKQAPTKTGRGSYIQHNSATMYWLQITEGANDWSYKEGDIRVTSKDFEPILSKLPEVTYEGGPIEIEICKSGRVYYYT